MATIKDIARRAGVSVATVSYVLNASRYVSPERREAVLLAVKELNYVPNAVARGLRSRESLSLGLIVSDITHPFYPELAKACEDVAQAAGYSLMVLNTGEQDDRLKKSVMVIQGHKVDGLIVASARLPDQPLLQYLVDTGYPLVLCHRRVPGLVVDSVVADNFGGAVTATRHLVKLGHRRIVMITVVTESYASLDRFEGYKQAMADAGLPALPGWMSPGPDQYKFSYSAAEMLLSLPLEQRPTAIIAGSDLAALAVLDAANDRRVQVPGDLAVVGFGDRFFAGARGLQLTTVRLPAYDIGREGTQLLLDRLAGKSPSEPVQKILPAPLIVRRTCGAVAASSS